MIYNKYLVKCIKCGKERNVSYGHYRSILTNKSLGKCLNCANLGQHRSKETKNKISKTRLERHLTFPSLLGYKHSLESRKKMSLARLGRFTGEDSPTWQGGKKLERYPFLFNQELKNRIKNKFGNRCWWCKREKLTLCVHHINSNKHDCRDINLIPLCFYCHSTMHQLENKALYGKITDLKNHPRVKVIIEKNNIYV